MFGILFSNTLTITNKAVTEYLVQFYTNDVDVTQTKRWLASIEQVYQ